MSAESYLDIFLFAVLPYVALASIVIVSTLRYKMQRFSYSSLSSQFLENRTHFWSMVPFHYGLVIVLLGHFVAFLIPGSILMWNGDPMRLFILEVTTLIFAILALVGIVGAMFRRISNPKVAIVTSQTDWVLNILLLIQIITGIGIAVFMSWGSSWYASSAAPYLWSLVKLSPEIAYISPMPFFVKLHTVSAFIIVLIFPFTRLVHILVTPLHYFARQIQVVRWNYDRGTMRDVE
jgi:nitrate reductase gamma subunit